MVNPLEPGREVALTVSQTLLNSRAESSKNLLEEALSSAVYTGAQMPLEGVAQLVDKISGSKTQTSVHFMDAPTEADFLSKKWLAQQGGAAIGLLPWFVAAHKGCGALMGRTGLAPSSALKLVAEGEKLSLKQALQVNTFRAAEAAGAGLFVGGVLTPVGPENMGDFWTARTRHATSSALTFATLSLSASGIRMGADKLTFSKPMLSKVLGHEATSGLLAGIPAGIVSANSESLLAGKGFAKTSEVGKQVTTFGLLGFGFGAMNSFGKGRESSKSPAELRGNDLTVNAELTGDRAVVPTTRTATGSTAVADVSLALKLTTEPVAPRLVVEPSATASPEVTAVLKGAGQDVPVRTGEPVDATVSGPKPEAQAGTRGTPGDSAARGEVKTLMPNGDLVIEKPNGITVTRAQNGDTTIRHADGTSVRTQTDGWTVKFDVEGREVERNRSKAKTPVSEREFNVASMNVDPLAKEMSNLSQRPFVLDGVRFESVEGFYRWLQWSAEPGKAAEMPALHGKEARAAGKGCTHTQATFRGKTFELGSPEHHEVIKIGIRESLRQNPDLAKRFAETHPRPIIHNTGRAESRNTKLPGTVFSRILMEVRQEIVDGKLKPDEPAAATGADATKPAVPGDRPATVSDQPGITVSDALRQISDPAIRDHHPVDAYARALANTPLRVSGFLGAGHDCIVFETPQGQVLKVTSNYLSPELGKRPFDLPLLESGAGRDQALAVNWFTQAKEGRVPTIDQVRQFGRELDPNKYMLTDPNPNNLRFHQGQLKLSDYWAVQQFN